MKNVINFFYGINADNIVRNNNDYYFFYKNKKFIFCQLNNAVIDYRAIYRLNQLLIRQNYPFFEIILNKNNEIITTIQANKYILMIDNDVNDGIFELYDSLQTNIKIEKNTKDISCLIRTNWLELWKNKIDYLESFINYNINKYYNIKKYINYFIGIAENGVSYLHYILNIEHYDITSNLVVSHKRVNINSIKDLYNPLNLIIDHPSRDVAEFLRSFFFYNGTSTYDFIEDVNLSREDTFCVIARLLFPSYFFDLFDRLVLEKITEDDMLKLIDKTNEYEIYLLNTINYFKTKYNIIEINWLKKVDYSSTLITPKTSGTSLTNIDSIPSFNVTSIMLQ